MRIVIFVFLIMLPFSIKESEAGSSSTPSYGGTLYWGTHNKPTIINPILTTASVSMSLQDLIFNRLVRLNPKGEIEPDLAQYWEISDDGLAYTFYLKKDIRFHDGVECTAEDVKFTYDMLIDPDIDSPFRSQFSLVREVMVMDRYTVQVILKSPSAPFIYKLFREIVPKHIFQGQDDLRNNPFNKYPIGTGPFMFKEWAKDDTIILEYNPRYHEGRSYLDKIVVKTYPSSQDAWIALMRGEVDYADFIEKEDYEIIKDDPSFKAYAFPVDVYYGITYDLHDPILSDIKIRLAIAHAIDRKELIKRVAFGYGLECNGPFYPGSTGFDPDVKPLEYNPERSLELLNGADWSDTDNDGIFEKNGRELELRILIDSGSDRFKRIIMFIRQELQKIGIKIEVKFYTYGDTVTGEFLKKNRINADLRLLLAGIEPDQAGEYWNSEEPKRFSKVWTYKNEVVNELFKTGKNIQDKEERKKIYEEIHKIVYEEQPICFLYFPFMFSAVSNRFENVEGLFNTNMPYYTMKDWYLK